MSNKNFQARPLFLFSLFELRFFLLRFFPEGIPLRSTPGFYLSMFPPDVMGAGLLLPDL